VNREQLEEIRAGWEEQNEWHLASHGAWRCCSACAWADKRGPALLDEIDRLHVVVRRVISITQDTDGDPLDVDEEIPVGEVLRMLYEFDHLAASVNDAWAAWPAGATTAEGSTEGGTSKGSEAVAKPYGCPGCGARYRTAEHAAGCADDHVPAEGGAHP
jgi:hypothetical protein